MNRYSRRAFLIRFLPALAPLAIAQVGYPMPSEPETPAVTIDSLNKRVMFLEQDRLITGLTVKWLQYNVKVLMKCFRGCGTMIPKQRYRI